MSDNGLFHGNGFRQVARLIHIRALDQGDVVGEQLQRYRVDDGGYHLFHVVQAHHPHGLVALEAGVRIGEHVEDTATGTDFFHVGFELLQQVVVRCHHYDGHLGIDQRQRAVLELTGGIGLGMDVGDLLELERPLHGDGVLAATTEEQAVMLVGKLFGQGFDLLGQRQALLDAQRQGLQRLDQLGLGGGAQVATAVF